MMYRKLCSVASATVFLFAAAIGSGHAKAGRLDYPDYTFGPAETNGLSAHIQLNVLFGREHERRQPTVTLTAGPVWQAEPSWPSIPASFRQTSVVALEYSLGSRPVFKLAGLHMLGFSANQLNTQRSDHTVRNIVLGVVAAAAIAGVMLAVWVHEVCKHSPEPEPGDPSCP